MKKCEELHVVGSSPLLLRCIYVRGNVSSSLFSLDQRDNQKYDRRGGWNELFVDSTSFVANPFYFFCCEIRG